MKALLIKDMPVTAELDGKDMAAVVGGTSQGCGVPTVPYCPPPSYAGPQLDYTKSVLNFDAAQMLSQAQNTVVNNGNNVAFSSGITANVNPHQTGKNTINFG